MTRFVRLPGLTDYVVAHELQRTLLEARIRDEVPDTVLLLEHAPVITLGRKRTADGNVLDAAGWPVVHVERGGDATWHGPGQLVAYPIVKLVGARADLHRHLHALEDAVIGLCAELGLHGHRDDRNTGVWLGDRAAARKVCSIGIACRRWVTWHGLALNIDPDLEAFARIRPCGFDASIMTRLADHLRPPPLPELAEALAAHLARTLELPPGPVEVVTAEHVAAGGISG